MSNAELLQAPVPAMSRHPAGTLRGGQLLGLSANEGYEFMSMPGGAPDWAASYRAPASLLEDLNGDGLTDAVAVAHCSAGGVSWPDTVLVYAPESSSSALLTSRASRSWSTPT